MKLSNETKQILANFAKINQNVYFQGGHTISSMGEDKNIVASAVVVEEFSKPFGIYSLSEFLSTVNMFQAPNIEINDGSCTLSDESSRAEYILSDPSVLTYPDREVKMPTPDVTLQISKDQLTRVKAAAAALSVSIFSIRNDNGKLQIAAVDAKNPSSSSNFTMDIEGEAGSTDFEFNVSIDSLKLMPGDYKVELSGKAVSRWTHDTLDLNYLIALERNSSYGN